MNFLGGMGVQVATSAPAVNSGSNNYLFGNTAVRGITDHTKAETVTSHAPSEMSLLQNAHVMSFLIPCLFNRV